MHLLNLGRHAVEGTDQTSGYGNVLVDIRDFESRSIVFHPTIDLVLPRAGSKNGGTVLTITVRIKNVFSKLEIS